MNLKNVKNELIGKWTSFLCVALVIVLTISIIFFIASKGLAIFFSNHISFSNVFLNTDWYPDRSAAEGGPSFGILPFLAGSIVVSLFAVLLSAPLSIISAFFITEIAPSIGQRFLQPAVELLAGIPSVVYGWIGLSVLVPFIRSTFGGLGVSVLAAGLVLAVMILPTTVSVATDRIKALPNSYKEASYALGSTRWQLIRRVLFPAALPGIMTGLILGLSRAFGEALAVQMVLGNVRKIPHSLLEPATTLTSGITMDMGYTAMGSPWNNALWTMALVLLIMSFFFIIIIRLVSKRGVNR